MNRSLWGIRLYYFLWLGGGGFLLPFINLFYVRQGLSGAEIGWLAAIGAVLGVICAPLWGRWSDSLSHPRRVLQVMLIGSALTYLALSQQRLFWIVAAIYVPLGILGAGLAPISDTLTLTITGGTRSGFGSVRLWGSLGWALLAFSSGLFIEHSGLLAAFGGYALALVLSAVALNFMPLGQNVEGATKPARPTTTSKATSWRSLIGKPALLGLALTLTVYMLSNNPQAQFEPIYLNQLGAQEGIIGLASTIGALVELPSMLWADRLIRQHGSFAVLLWSFLMRVGLQGIILLAPSIPTLLAMRAVNGIAFSFYTVAGTMFVAEHSPAEGRATLMAIFSVTLPALVRMASGPLGGWAFDTLGAYQLYTIALVGNALAWVVLYLTGKGMQKWKSDRLDEPGISAP